MDKPKSQDTAEFKIQDNQYQFPYHYIPHFENGIGKTIRYNPNSYEYLCYTKHVEEIINSISPNSALEVGCGDGKIIGSLNKVPERLGVDLSEKAISFAKAFNPNVKFEIADIATLSKTFDVVFAVEVLEHIPDDQMMSFLRSLADRVKDNGHLIITVPSKVKPMIAKHFRHYDIELFKSHIQESNAKLKIEKVEYIFKKTKLLKLYKILTNNKYWFLQLNFLMPKIWCYVWEKLRIGSEGNGEHLVVTLQKYE